MKTKNLFLLHALIAGLGLIPVVNCIGQPDAPELADLSPNPVLATSKATLGHVVLGNGSFAAVGSGGTILTSRDGAAWVKRNSGPSHKLHGIALDRKSTCLNSSHIPLSRMP